MTVAVCELEGVTLDVVVGVGVWEGVWLPVPVAVGVDHGTTLEVAINEYGEGSLMSHATMSQLWYGCESVIHDVPVAHDDPPVT